MNEFSTPARPSSPSPERCPRCGGTGHLRTGHGAYRTCLECAARGILGSEARAPR